MSHARWCDYGDHPFAGGRPGTVVMALTEQVNNQWGGTQPSTVPASREICPECAAELGMNPDYTAPEMSPGQRKQQLAKLAASQKSLWD
jgi:hypothetical protein